MTGGQASAPFEWTEVRTIDEMRAFFLSRLDAIRAAAMGCGYAIGVHGSLTRDFDLIAAPWVEGCATPDALAGAVHDAACGLRHEAYNWERKPLGRVATSLAICWTEIADDRPGLGHIDLSVAPCVMTGKHDYRTEGDGP